MISQLIRLILAGNLREPSLRAYNLAVVRMEMLKIRPAVDLGEVTSCYNCDTSSLDWYSAHPQ